MVDLRQLQGFERWIHASHGNISARLSRHDRVNDNLMQNLTLLSSRYQLLQLSQWPTSDLNVKVLFQRENMLQHKVHPSDKLNEHLTGLTSSFTHTGIQSIWIQLSFMVQSNLSLLRECNRLLIENDSVMHLAF